jgi:PIN domain nuclease of toxin-antitoxin system
MNVLLDTHAFLWWAQDDPMLSQHAREVLGSGEVAVFFSVASVWEIVVKTSLGRLVFRQDPASVIGELLETNGFQVLPIHLRHALALAELPAIHSDPFDRMLVAQARSEGLALLTADRWIGQYPVDIIW